MIKKTLLLSMVLPLSLQAKSLANLDEIRTAILGGKEVHTAIDFTSCEPSFPHQAYFKPNAVLMASDHITFADNHITTNHPWFPGKVILENVTYRVDKSGDYTITTRMLNPKTYKKLKKDDITLHCQLGRGADIFDQ